MNKKSINRLDKNLFMMKNINKRLMKDDLKHYKITNKENKSKILIWKPRCPNAWQIPFFIGQNSELLIWLLIKELVANP
jgi:hypothetical protein